MVDNLAPTKMRASQRRRWGWRSLRPSDFIASLRFAWILAILWYEIGGFIWSSMVCSWPDTTLANSKGTTDRELKHVLLVADPQVIDSYSYPGRSWWLGALSQLFVDLNLRKNWFAAQRLHPDVIIFLGDMMDNGRLAYSDEEYQSYVRRFKSIFSTDTEVYYLPGNHDVGLGGSHAFSPKARARFTDVFGPLNHAISIANHTLVMIDAPGLVDEDYKRYTKGENFENYSGSSHGTVGFVNNFASIGSKEPVILFSHIPLFRPDTTSCGPLREKGTIRRGAGFGYQNTLGRQTSDFLLKNIQPQVIYSGDDHDYCEYTHSILLQESPEPKLSHVREVTLKSFSMVMGIRRPGFQLLSLATPTDEGGPSHADALCLLPDQLGIYLSRYIPLFVLSLFALSVLTVRDYLKAKSNKQRLGATVLFDEFEEENSLGASGYRIGKKDAQLSPESSFTPSFLITMRGPTGNSMPSSYRVSRPTTPLTPDIHITNTLYPPYGDKRSLSDEELFLEYPSEIAELPHGYSLSKPKKGCLQKSFTLFGRRRRIGIEIPTFLQRIFSAPLSICRRKVYSPTRKSMKRVWSGKQNESVLGIFVAHFRAVAWLPVSLFVIINLFMFV